MPNPLIELKHVERFYPLAKGQFLFVLGDLNLKTEAGDFVSIMGPSGAGKSSLRRTQEIGVRMALGARSADVVRMITGHGMRLIAIGLGIGFLGAYFLMQLLAGSLHGVSAHDPLSFTVIPLILFLVGLIACYIPARHATRLNPTEALRCE